MSAENPGLDDLNAGTFVETSMLNGDKPKEKGKIIQIKKDEIPFPQTGKLHLWVIDPQPIEAGHEAPGTEAE